MGGMELDQLQERPLDRRQRRLFRQEGVAHATEQLLQLRGQLRVQVLTDAREDEKQAIRLRYIRNKESAFHQVVSTSYNSVDRRSTHSEESGARMKQVYL